VATVVAKGATAIEAVSDPNCWESKRITKKTPVLWIFRTIYRNQRSNVYV
jgi:hypothetical protein